ncbi:MAG: agmatine deiminase family protein [Bacteroides sp.]|nr:agmatine deiminase family protein [Bacteroides sp.]
MTTKFDLSRRFPAEWECDCAVLLAWPHHDTDWNYMLPWVHRCYADVIRAIIPWQPVILIAPDISIPLRFLADIDPTRLFFVELPTDDTWTRDYGPLSVFDSEARCTALDFCFNGWGLKFAAACDNLVTSRLSSHGLLTAPVINCRDFVLEGGGIESDGHGSLMTTSRCQLSPNRNATLSCEQIADRLLAEFGARQVLWVDHGYLAGDDTDSHIDTLARFAPDDTIVFVGCQDPSDEHFEELSLMKEDLLTFRTLDGRPFNLMELPMPSPIFDSEGHRLPATYANFLALPDVVIMPSYGQPRTDGLARRILEVAFCRHVVSVDCRALIQQHGSLHCATMQIPKQILAI